MLVIGFEVSIGSTAVLIRNFASCAVNVPTQSRNNLNLLPWFQWTSESGAKRCRFWTAISNWRVINAFPSRTWQDVALELTEYHPNTPETWVPTCSLVLL